MGKYNRPTKPKQAVVTPEGQIIAKEQIKKGDAVIATPIVQEAKTMNIYQKMQLIRKAIAEADIERSSKNAEKGFTYLELPDYLPLINKLGAEHGIMTHFNMTADEATLKVINTEKPEELLEWTLPVKTYEMADAQEIQILKGTTTYMRRTLFEVAFEISVKDTVDAATGGAPAVKEDALDPRDIRTIEESSDVESLNVICQNIRHRKGFKSQNALLLKYTQQKNKLEGKK